MNRKIFWSALLLIFFYISIKLVFVFLEPKFFENLLGKVDILILILAILWSIYLYYEDGKTIDRQVVQKLSTNSLVLVISILFTVLISLVFNLNKKALDWDAVALYDSRAKILQSGVKFSDMNMLSKYDDKNKYYYLLYPPFTSIEHFVYYELGSRIPVSVIYTFNLIILAVVFGLISVEFLSVTGALISVFLLVSNKDIFSISIIEYTNLPFTTFVVVGSMVLLYAIRKNKSYLYSLGFLLISATSWIRYLEPVWLIVIISFLVTMFTLKQYKNNRLISALGLTIVLIQYLSWGYFQKYVSNSPTIFNLTPFMVMESLAGLFSGSFISILLYYIKSFGVVFIVYIVSLIKINKDEPKEYLFIRLIIFLTLVMYFAGIYGISFMFDWWKEMSGSLVRSSSYLIPLSIFLIVSNLKYLLENKLGSSKTIDLRNIIKHIKHDKK